MKTNGSAAVKRLRENAGMTLTEVLVAMAVLMIAIMCFLPLAQSSFKNIYTVGEKTKSNYKAVGLIERLIGNTGANGDYEVSTADVPLRMKAGSVSIQANSSSLQSINGISIVSTPENVPAGFSTFICDSVTAKMVCYPSHISDDFRTKTITLYASGFRFSSVSEFQIYYTDATGKQQIVPGIYNDANPYCRVEIDKDNASIVHLTLVGDNDVICFEHSPLVIKYRVYELTVEIDAPTVIMVGEQAEDGNYYYYVTSGEPDENGNLDIIRKKMNSTDPLGKLSGNITLTSAMNDVEWVAAGEGDDGNGGVNQYGYYVMCGDNGQIRRFWKNPVTGNYGWGGDYTIAHEYYYNNGVETVTDKKMYSTTVDSSYVYVQTPGETTTYIESNDPTAGICLITDHNDVKYDDDYAIWNSLFTQTAFSINALQKHPEIEVYTAGNLLWAHSNYDSICKEHGESDFSNGYVNDATNDTGGWTYYFANGGGYGNTITSGNNTLRNNTLNKLNATQKLKASEMTSYATYYQLDQATDNYITLTSVDAVKMSKTYTSSTYPTQSYTLYCGYIPAVMDLWTTNLGVARFTDYNYGEWRATLGLAFQDTSDTAYIEDIGQIYYHDSYKSWGTRYYADITGYLWEYGRATAKNYSLSGVCGPTNYAPEKNSALAKTMQVAASLDDFGKEFYPLNSWEFQAMLQNQNETVISVSYLSNPYALASKDIEYNNYALSPDRQVYDGVFEWCFSDSTTIMDTDSIYYEDYDGNGGYFSIAVGYYVGGLVFDSHDKATEGMVAVPTVMNNSVVFLRAGGANDEGMGKGFYLQQESNVFNEFFSSNDYWHERQSDNSIGTQKNTLEQAVSAGYWRDKYHPLFYSLFGGAYVDEGALTLPKYANRDRDKYSYLMSHILQGKKLTSVSWGWTWQETPEAMWGADDGTLMSWYLNIEPVKNEDSYVNERTVTAEFQSYKWLQQGIQYKKMYLNNSLDARYSNAIGYDNDYNIPVDVDDLETAIKGKRVDETKDDSLKGYGGKDYPIGAYTNAYWDKCSIQLGKTETLGFMSPLDTVEDVTYANDTWVACGVQGLANPCFDSDGNRYCRDGAVVKKAGSSAEGSWVCVRSWYDQSGGTDKGPVAGNCNYVWQAVQISQIKNCNIQQVTYCNGMWYAVGYIDTNDNGEYDYTVESGQEREHAVVFYAVDPTQPCGTEKGWKLSDPGNVGYTQAYANTGTGNYTLLNIDGVNSVASRND
ncbi:MAG: hypothetical protein ACI4K9_05460 [Candidatus Fimenecus sp.]